MFQHQNFPIDGTCMVIQYSIALNKNLYVIGYEKWDDHFAHKLDFAFAAPH